MFPRKCNVCNRELSDSVDVDIHKIYHKGQNNECLFTSTCCKKLFSNATDFKVYDDTLHAMNPTAAEQLRQPNRANHKLNTGIDENLGYSSFDPEYLRQTNINHTGLKNSIHAPSTNSTTLRIRKTPTKCSRYDPKRTKQTKSRQVRQALNQRKSNVRKKTNPAINANKQTENSQPCTSLNLQAAEQNRETETRSENITTQSTMRVSQSLKAMTDKKCTQNTETTNSRTDTAITLSTTDTICCKRFSMKRNWNKHKSNRTSLKVYSCDSCDQSFPTLFNFKLRLKRVRKGNSTQIWKICNQSFKGSCQCSKQKAHHTEKDFKSKRNASQNPPVVAMETSSKMENGTRVEARSSKSFTVPSLQITLIPNPADNARINNMDNSMCSDLTPQGTNVCMPTECKTSDVKEHSERSPHTSTFLEITQELQEPTECGTPDVGRHMEISSSQVIDVFDKPTACRNSKVETMPHVSSRNSSVELHHGPEIIDLTSCDTDDEDQLRHELEATEPTGVTYICFKCHTEFEMPGQLLEHVDNVHSRHVS